MINLGITLFCCATGTWCMVDWLRQGRTFDLFFMIVNYLCMAINAYFVLYP